MHSEDVRASAIAAEVVRGMAASIARVLASFCTPYTIAALAVGIVALSASTTAGGSFSLATFVSSLEPATVLALMMLAVGALGGVVLWSLWKCANDEEDDSYFASSLGLDSPSALGYLPHHGPLVNVPGVPLEPGATGLRNLGNTCYMNSTLSCLSAMPDVTAYFLSGEYKKHLNEANPLGTRGAVATAYAELLSRLWSGKYIVVAPTEFHAVFGSHVPQFQTNEQQDNQEFLMALLDKLAEDLNQGCDVIQSPSSARYRMCATSDADPSSPSWTALTAPSLPPLALSTSASAAAAATKPRTRSTRSTDTAAREEWGKHVARNRSIIADKFQGQQVCVTACTTPGCGFVSRNYDTLMYLSLPLPPVTITWRIPCIASALVQHEAAGSAGAGGRASPSARGGAWFMRLSFQTPHACTADDVCAIVDKCARAALNAAAEAEGVHALPPFSVTLAVVSSGRFQRCIAPHESLRHVSPASLVAYLLPALPHGTPTQSVVVYQRVRQWRMVATPGVSSAYQPRAVLSSPPPPGKRLTLAPVRRWLEGEVAAASSALSKGNALAGALSNEWDGSSGSAPPAPAHEPDYNGYDVLLPCSVPLLLRYAEGTPAACVRSAVDAWCAASWAHRDLSCGIGVEELIPSAAPAPAPAPVHSSPTYAGASTETDAYRGVPVTVPPLRGYPPRLCRSTVFADSCPDCAADAFCHHCGAWFDAAPAADASHSVTAGAVITRRLDGVPEFVCATWFHPDDAAPRVDNINVQPCWNAFRQLTHLRATQLAATPQSLDADGASRAAGEEALRAPGMRVANPMAVMPLTTYAWQTRALVGHPAPLYVSVDAHDEYCVSRHDGSWLLPPRTAAATTAAAAAAPAQGIDTRSASAHRDSIASTRPVVEPDSVSLDTCLSLYSKETLLTGDNMYHCPSCARRVEARQSMQLIRLPQILVIVLKRFVYLNAFGDTDKVEARVDFPLHGLNLRPWVAADDARAAPVAPAAAANTTLASLRRTRRASAATRGDASSATEEGAPAAHGSSGGGSTQPPPPPPPPHGSEPVYDLFAVCNHTGTLAGGHHTAAVRHPLSGHWYSYNDHHVAPVLPTDVRAFEYDAAEAVLLHTPERILAHLQRAAADGGHVAEPEVEAALKRALVTPNAYVLMYRRRP